MAKLSRRDACRKFATDPAGDITTYGSMSFRHVPFKGGTLCVAYSYAEPIALTSVGGLYRGRLMRTTGKFSMTTSHHKGAVGGAWAVEHGSENVVDIDHGRLRAIVKDAGLPVGSWGASYDV